MSASQDSSSTKTEDGPPSRPGLRERKKLKTKQRLREEAVRLFMLRGFDETTTEQIAEAAEVSPSTFFRYFPTKEAVLHSDGLDPLVVEGLRGQPLDKHPVRAVRDAIASTFVQMTSEEEQQFLAVYRLTTSTPALRGHLYQHMLESLDLFADTLAEWRGASRDDPAVRALVGAMVGVILQAVIEWADGAGNRHLRDLIDEYLARLEEGFSTL